MGVDCRIWLPGRVRILDVADVIGILAGMKPEKRPFSTSEDGGWSTHVPNVRTEGIPEMPHCALIYFEHNGETRTVLYHFEPGAGERLLMPSSTALWLAIGSGLIHFFGGRLDYNDCDSEDANETATVNYDIAPSDGEPWYEFQQRKLDLKALTKEDIDKYKPNAAYG